jgi:hypothetical protein
MRHPVRWRQLYAIARDSLKADPTLDNVEWSERIKDRIVALGLTYPERPDAIHSAMRAVEHVVKRDPPRTSRPATTAARPPPPYSQAESVAFLAALGARIRSIG